jgi:hypothetical protein
VARRARKETSGRWLKLAVISVPAAACAAIVMAALVEVGVRATWDPKRGTPGFYVADPIRGQRLGAGYNGWFAGVPVQINRLGFRDPREYSLQKKANTFRILVMGDSVTFGHGAVFLTTYPYLLEQQLVAWNPAIDWQVWNLGVPGYNTRQELLYLKEVAPTFQPDLVILGFFPNDVTDNAPVPEATTMARAMSRVTSWTRAHWWSLEFYKRTYLTLIWKLTAREEVKRRFEQLAAEDSLSAPAGALSDEADQQLTPFDRLTGEQLAALRCPTGSKSGPQGSEDLQRDPQWPAFVEAVGELQALHKSGAVHLVFFLNMAPPTCPDGDFFYEGGIRYVNQVVLDLFRRGAPAVSPLEAFFPLRPSQMPRAGGHSLGNANWVKAQVLFQYLREHVLPGRVPH